MKKLNKLHINPEKLMKSEELLLLRGGYDTVGCSADDCISDSQCPSECSHCRQPADPYKNKRCYSS